MLKGSKAGYNNKVDIWSLGCLIFEMITGRKAFSGDYSVFEYTWSEGSQCSFISDEDSDENSMLLAFRTKTLLSVDQNKRPSAREFKTFNQNLQSAFQSRHEGLRNIQGDFSDLPKLVALECAISEGRSDETEALLARVDTEFVTTHGAFLLHNAITKGCIRAVTALLHAGANGYEALNLLASLGDVRGIETMLAAGVDANHTVEDKSPTAIASAISNNQINAVIALLEGGGRISGSDAAWLESKAVIRVAAQVQARICSRFGLDDSWTILHGGKTNDSDVLTVVNDESSLDWVMMTSKESVKTLDLSLIHTFTLDYDVRCVTFSPCGQYIAVASNGYALIFEVTKGKRYATLSDSTDKETAVIRSLRFTDSDHLVTGGTTLVLWTLSSPSILTRFLAFDADVACLDVCHGRDLLVSGFLYEKVTVWRISSGESLFSVSARGLIHSVALSSDGEMVASRSSDNQIRVWYTKDAGQIHAFQTSDGSVTAVTFAHNGDKIISASWFRSVHVWRLFVPTTTVKQKECILSLRGADAFVCVASSPDDRWIAAGTLGRGLYFWDSITGQKQCVLRAHITAGLVCFGDWLTRVVSTMAFSNLVSNSTSRLFATGGTDGAVRLWGIS